MVGAFFTGAAIPIFSYFFAVDINVIAGIEGDDMEGDTKQNMVYLAINSVVTFFVVILMCWALAKVAASITYDSRYQ